jgi:chlorobactene glucosyltransferase
MMDYFSYYQYIITALLFIILLNFIINNISYRSPSNYALPEKFYHKPSLVSVLIPARDEEKKIGGCLRSLGRQDYGNIEILVLDDNSSDKTNDIVNKWSGRDARIRLIKGKPLIRGWKGKTYACHQLSREARGEYLIFTDADTLHFPDSVSSSLAALETNGLDAISVFPRQIMVSIHERMVVIFINIALLALLPLFLVKKIKSPRLSIANGQFFLFKKKVYDRVGGHRNIKKDIVEDVALSRQVKKCGFKFRVFDGRKNIHCRMYEGFGQVVTGFSKFIFAAMNYNILSLISVITMILLLFLFPFIFLPLGILLEWPLMVNMNLFIQVSIILIIRIVMTFRFKSKLVDIFLHPLSMVYIAVLSVNSVMQAKYGKGIYWKDRYYSIDDIREDGTREFVK